MPRIYKETDYATNLVGYSHGLGFSSYGAGSINEAMLAYDDPAVLHERRELNVMTFLHGLASGTRIGFPSKRFNFKRFIARRSSSP
jgi:hypothetical protein